MAVGMKYNFFGYTLSACLHAREHANKGHDIAFYATAPLGYPCDKICEWLTFDGVRMLHKICGSFSTRFKKVINGARVLRKDEHLQFPISEASMSNPTDAQSVREMKDTLPQFLNRLAATASPFNAYRDFIKPSWVHDDIAVPMTLRKCGVSDVKELCAMSIAYAMHLGGIDMNGGYELWRPVNGFKALCEEVLSHPNIKVTYLDYRHVAEPFNEATKNKERKLIMLDNRIDAFMNYRCGFFRRTRYAVTKVENSHGYGVVFTPMSEGQWATSTDFAKTMHRINVVPMKDINGKDKYLPSNMPMTVHNERVVKAYFAEFERTKTKCTMLFASKINGILG